MASKYNAFYRRSTKRIPKDVYKVKETQVWINLLEQRLSHKRRKRRKFSVWDFFRLNIKKAPFMKRYQEIWTQEVLVIDAIVYGNPATYKINDQDNELMKGHFMSKRFS